MSASQLGRRVATTEDGQASDLKVADILFLSEVDYVLTLAYEKGTKQKVTFFALLLKKKS